MRAVNLLPPEHRRGRGVGGPSLRGPGYVLVGLLVLALAVVTVYVVTSNSVADQKSKLIALQQQVPQVQAAATRLVAYSQFSNLAQQRAQTVRQIAATRFDWAASMADLSRVVPANTSLQALVATSGGGSAAGSGSSGGSSAGGSTGAASGVRGALPNPAFELKGCTASQDDVARLMSRLRLMNGVIRVTLSTAAKQGTTSQPGSAATTSSASPTSSPTSGASTCPPNASGFDLVVFFAGAAGAPTSGSGSAQASPTSSQGASSSAHSAASTTGAPSGGTP